MTTPSLSIVVLGLSLSSSWGNGHATTYRALLKALAERGHRILFLERDVPWYARHRDQSKPAYCQLKLYDNLDQLRAFEAEVTNADAVVVGSYVPQGTEVIDWILKTARGTTAFYDIDTPVTLSALENGECTYLRPAQIPRFDLYLSFSGGPMLEQLTVRFGAKAAVALYCSADADVYRPTRGKRAWDLGYLGTYSRDRDHTLDRLLLGPARRRPDLRFVIAGPQYPCTSQWPENVQYIAHLAPSEHPRFYCSLRWTLNLTRADMVRAGYSPSVRLFEAAACGTPIISDEWPGLETIFTAREICRADRTEAVLAALDFPEHRRREIGQRARKRFLSDHNSRRRAADLERLLLAMRGRTAVRFDETRCIEVARTEPNRKPYVSTPKLLT